MKNKYITKEEREKDIKSLEDYFKYLDWATVDLSQWRTRKQKLNK